MSQITCMTPITNEEAREAINRELGASEWDIASRTPGVKMLPISSVEVASLCLYIMYRVDLDDGRGPIEESICMTLTRGVHDPERLNVNCYN